MKKLVILFALLLASCSSRGGNSSSSSESSESSSSSGKEALELTYTGNPVEIMSYGSTFSLADILVNGEKRDDIPLNYILTDRDPAATLNEDNSLTAVEYVREARMGNINEFVNVRVEAARPYLSNPLSIKVLVALYEPNVTFDKILQGNDYTFYTSEGVIENFNRYTSPSDTDWYADCYIRDLNSENVLKSTITKNYSSIQLESTIVTSHFKMVIKRDERGAGSVRDIRDGDRVKFITMYNSNEISGRSYSFNSIITEVVSHDDEDCNVTNYDSSLDVSISGKKYGDTFTVTAPKEKYVHVKGVFGVYGADAVEEVGDNNVHTFTVKSKINRIYTIDNVPDSSKELLASYRSKTEGGGGLYNKDAITDVLFNGEHEGSIEGLKVTSYETVSAGTGGLNLGAGGFNSHVTFVIPRKAHVNYIVIYYSILSINKNINIHYTDAGFFTSRETGRVSTVDSSLEFQIKMIDDSTSFDPSSLRGYDYTEISIWIHPSSEGYETGICIRGISFYTYDNFVEV